MFSYYFRVSLKNLWINKKYSAINITGFAFSLSIFLMTVLYILHEYSYDRYHRNSTTIYRLTDTEENSSSIDYRVKDVLLSRFTDIENACLYQQVGDQSVKYNNSGYYVENVSSIDAAFFEMFDVEFLEGNDKRPFNTLNSVVITESTANKLFNNEDLIGKEFELNYKGIHPLIVSGIIKDFPNNSSIEVGIFVNAENDAFKFNKSQIYENGNSFDLWPFSIYLQLDKNNDPNSILTALNSNIKLLKPYVHNAGLIPLHDVYLFDKTRLSGTKRGNPGLIRVFLAVAIVILFLSVINYVNLSIAQQQKRGKEIGVRKTIGASKKDIIIQLLFESVIVTFLAFGISLILFELFLHLLHDILKIPISLSVLFTFPINLIMFLAIFLIGIITGIWPALVFSSVDPIQIFGKRIISKGRKNYAGNALTVFQFAVSIVLIFCVAVIWKQIEFSKNKDLGFNTDRLLKVDVPRIEKSGMNNAIGMINKLRDLTYITNLSVSSSVPGEIKVHIGSVIEGKNRSIALMGVDSAFLKTFGIDILHGRDFFPGDAGKVCMINKAAMDYFEWDNIENKILENIGGYEVVGVVEDFHLSSIHNPIEPLMIIYDSFGISHLNIKISGNNIGKTMNYLKKTWKETLSEYPLEYRFYDDWFNSMYEKEERLGKIISLFAVLAISISCIGILGLAIFTSERRTKEIGIRKVNGAHTTDILILLNKNFINRVLVAFVIASPIAWFSMYKWLEGFAYKTEISWWIFLLGGGIALFIALLTVSWQSWMAARRNPVEALRYE